MLQKLILATLAGVMVTAAVVPSGAATLRPAAPAADGIVVDASYHGKRHYSDQHYRWCAARYKSYDWYSNTYQPYYGPRRQCVSPYS